MENIVLIGMPGAGKSTVGVLLAKALGMPFTDTDLVIQEKEHRLLQDIINQEGIKRFLEIEESTIINVNLRNHVIATGGSVVYSQPAMAHLKDEGIILYLKLGYQDIEKRIRNMKSRGIAMEKGQTLHDIYHERVKLYEQYADIIVDCSTKDIEETVSLIKEIVLERMKRPEI